MLQFRSMTLTFFFQEADHLINLFYWQIEMHFSIFWCMVDTKEALVLSSPRLAFSNKKQVPQRPHTLLTLDVVLEGSRSPVNFADVS